MTYNIIDWYQNENNCNLQDRWDEWTSHYFGSEAANISLYDDNDNDGLVNIIEYYFDQVGKYSDWGLDPTDGDTDGDLLADGFEWYFGMNPKSQVC